MKLAPRMTGLGSEGAFEVLAKAQRLEAEGMDVIHLEIGEPDFDTPGNIVAAAAEALRQGHTRYGPSPGFTEVRERIAQAVSRTRNIPVSGDNVVITPGGKPIIFFTILALVDRGDEVLYPNPGFPTYESVIRLAGGVPIAMKLHEAKGFNVDVEEVARQITAKTRLMILNSPNNPCGSVTAREDLEALASLAQRNDLIVLSDEIYSRFIYEGQHYSVASFPGMQGRTVLLDGFSKTYAMTGWRVGYAVAPKAFIGQMKKVQEASTTCAVPFCQKAAIQAITGPQDSVVRMRDEFNRRRMLLVEGLNKIPGISCRVPKGAFFAFPNIKALGVTGAQLSEHLLKDAKVVTVPGSGFGKYGEGYIRLSYASSQENIKKALERMGESISKLKR